MTATIEVKSPIFRSELDEELFFIGLRLVGSVRSYKGIGRHLEIRLDPRRTAADEKNLSALLRRYEVAPQRGPK